MEDVVLQSAVEFADLLDPDELTTGLSMLIMGLLGLLLWAGLKLQSIALVMAWLFTVVVLVLSFVASLPFLTFWVMILVSSAVLALALVVGVLYG